MQGLMSSYPLTLTHLFERAERLFGDKTMTTLTATGSERTTYAEWALRTRRVPMLIVIDEAHNVCPGRPEDPLTALAADTVVRIAAEGRKFGLYLLVSSC